MFNVRNPLFNADGASDGGSSKPWDGFFPNSYTNNYADTPVEDVQPDVDTDTEAVDTDEVTQEQEEDETVYDDEGSDADHVEEIEESEEPAAVEDPDIDLGEGKKPVKMSELKNGYMRQSDYTKKTQELATQRKEVEALQESLKGAQGFHNHLQSNPWLWQQINTAIEAFNQTGVLPLEEVLEDAQYGQYINHLMSENNRLQTELGSLRGEFEGVRLSSDMQKLRNDLAADYGDLVTDTYMESLQERAKSEKLSATTLKEIAEGHLAKEKLKSNQQNVKKVSREAEAKTIQKLQEQRKKAPASPTTVAATPSRNNNNPYGEGWGDFFRRLTN